MTNETQRPAAKVQVTFRIDDALHTLAAELAAAHGGLSAVIRSGFDDYVSGRRGFEPEKFQFDSGSSQTKEKRVSMKLDEQLYAEVQRKAGRFGGVSGLVRAILKKHCASARTNP